MAVINNMVSDIMYTLLYNNIYLSLCISLPRRPSSLSNSIACQTFNDSTATLFRDLMKSTLPIESLGSFHSTGWVQVSSVPESVGPYRLDALESSALYLRVSVSIASNLERVCSIPKRVCSCHLDPFSVSDLLCYKYKLIFSIILTFNYHTINVVNIPRIFLDSLGLFCILFAFLI